jgi:hypothetical protein
MPNATARGILREVDAAVAAWRAVGQVTSIVRAYR